MPELAYAGRNAVLSNGWLALPGHSRVRVDGVGKHVGDIAGVAIDWCGADVVFVDAGGLDYLGLPATVPRREAHQMLEASRFVQAAVDDGWRIDGVDGAWRVRLRSAESGKHLRVVLLPYDHPKRGVAGPWTAAIADPELLIRGLSRFAHTTKFAWRDSTGKTAEHLIRSTHPRAEGGRQLEKQTFTPEPFARGELELPFSWRRPLEPAEREAAWVHHYDGNAAYLAAWGVAELGFGEPAAAGEFLESQPGIWLVDGDPSAAALAERGLPPVLEAGDVDGERWVTTPTLRRVVEVTGEVPRIRGSFVWPNRSRYLRATAELLREARAELRSTSDAADRLALEGVKAIYRVETGRLSSTMVEERTGWARPDWGDMIRGGARANLHRLLAGAPRKKSADRPPLGRPPFGILTDGLVFTSHMPDPLQFAQRIGLPIGDGMGEYSIEGSFLLDDVVVDELDAAGNAKVLFDVVRRRCSEHAAVMV